MLGKAIK